ncbi:hypothetical protein [Candidatus Methylacidithermus pantelleriae]|uniref:hypothetical protein n=1 Tax=Candidatus Methylacidithermus pantelleriae TaxID=2744239 RepID=UPI00157DF03A|nr:hypothetical protein [Candidatus Methylacidithermus pantelleriae]
MSGSIAMVLGRFACHRNAGKKRVVFFLLAFASWLALFPAPAVAREEWIIVSGGPALRFFEKNKPQKESHDHFWGNFIRAAVARIQQLQAQKPEDVEISWLVFRPGYERRGEEEHLDLLQAILYQAKSLGVNLYWFDNALQLVNYLNHGRDRRQVPVGDFEYFGHSNRACFMFDYSSLFDTLSKEFLHERDLPLIDKHVFARHAQAKSWGCHTGEEFSRQWKRRFGFPMVGAVGKTDYSTGALPSLSTQNGRWAE